MNKQDLSVIIVLGGVMLAVLTAFGMVFFKALFRSPISLAKDKNLDEKWLVVRDKGWKLAAELEQILKEKITPSKIWTDQALEDLNNLSAYLLRKKIDLQIDFSEAKLFVTSHNAKKIILSLDNVAYVDKFLAPGFEESDANMKISFKFTLTRDNLQCSEMSDSDVGFRYWPQ